MSESRNNNPSINPADNGSLAGSLRLAFNKLMQEVNGMLPARVIKYDRDENRVQVQLLITIVTTDGSQVDRQQVASLPVLLLGGGGFFLSFPIKEGDLGWVLANDRDISNFLQSYANAPPNTYRKFSFSDGLFIPDIMRGYTIAGEDDENAVLQNLDGTIKISLSETTIKITAPTVIVDGLLDAQGGISGGGAGLIPFTFTGNMHVVGDITASGSITPFTP
jgi:hypothetical protein